MKDLRKQLLQKLQQEKDIKKKGDITEMINDLDLYVFDLRNENEESLKYNSGINKIKRFLNI